MPVGLRRSAPGPTLSSSVLLPAAAPSAPTNVSVSGYGLPSRKNEDYCGYEEREGGVIAGVFDGHGGGKAAYLCASDMSGMEVEGEDGEEKMKKVFKKWEEKCRVTEEQSGTTATLVDVSPSDAGVTMLVGWVGDSRGVVVGQKSRAGELLVETVDHKLTNENERKRVMKATGNNVCVLTPPWVKPKGSPATPPKIDLDEPTAPGTNKQVGKGAGEGKGSKSALEKLDSLNLDFSQHADLDVTTKGGNVFQQLKAQSVPAVPAVPVPPETENPNPQSPPPAPSQPGRRGSFIAQRLTSAGASAGPWCLFSGQTGASLAVTRSLGDPDGAKSCIAEPEFLRTEVKAGEEAVAVLCSDGVWDVLSSADVAKIVGDGRRNKEVAKELRVAQVHCALIISHV
ncbi:hypothetical protein TeGR_g1076 [Tetraparma gracilis]|uniref:PPM-type phosphatase domain-containing protein n=1 Tax=Tetraparma gracilis TaxID=2962635 RepID=A0ABQ6ML06_9STRA|nr:hypothetical protein TeGR_g1076 [Tetraparma gracilis]